MLDRIHKISEIVAAFAIVASLIFVGVQVSQNTGALKATVASDMMSNWINVMAPFTTDSEFVEAQIQFAQAEGPDDISDEAMVRLLGFWGGGMKNAEFSYYRHLSGDMEDGLWLAMRNAALRPFNSAVMREAIWPSIRLELSPQFVQRMEAAIKNGEHLELNGGLEAATPE